MSKIHKFSDPVWLNSFVPVCCIRANSVLDVGAGIRPQTVVKTKHHTCIEPHGEYCEVLKKKGLGVIQEPAQTVVARLPSESVDVVTLLDVVEHLPKEESVEMLNHCIRIAKKQVVILTPLGYMPQTCDSQAADPWGLHGNYWQEHRSGWDIEDFSADGWQVYICDNFHVVSYQGDHHIPLEHPNGGIWAVYTKRHNLSRWDRLRVQHNFKTLWVWAFISRAPWFLPLRHQIVLFVTTKMIHPTMIAKHRLVVFFRIKEILRKLGVKIE